MVADKAFRYILHNAYFSSQVRRLTGLGEWLQQFEIRK